MTRSPSGWVDPNPPDPVDCRTAAVLVVSGVLLTALVIVTLIAVVLVSTHLHERTSKPEDLMLLAANTATANPFTRSILVAPVVISDATAAKNAEILRQVPVRADRGVRVASGRLPGLYGATGQTAPCDTATLANDLDQDPTTARTWGLALGITPQQIPHYLNTLTPVIALADTWVTTHQLVDKVAEPHQAVLQRGSAVLVDTLGVPRVQCSSGAPLTPPDFERFGSLRLIGDNWAEFSPDRIVAVNYSGSDPPELPDSFILLDVNSAQQVVRESGNTIYLPGASVPLPDPAVMNVPPSKQERGHP